MPPKVKSVKGTQKALIKKEITDAAVDEEIPLLALLDLQLASIKKLKLQVKIIL
jgi:hypothetical protein